MYNNPYLNNINLNERIDNEIERLKQMKTQVQTPITQNFQLAPTSSMRYANTIDDVKREMIYADTPFFSKDLSVMWLKSNKGDIRAFELNEIIEKDNKDIQIEYLMKQVEELKKEIKNNELNANIDEPIEDEKPTSVQSSSKFTKKSR